MEEPTGDQIADVVLSTFESLPKKARPLIRGGGVREWVPLSGIVAQVRDRLVCLSAATGMKCLPQSKIPQANGIVLHDWHAEILAIRSFNRFLLEECLSLVSSDESSSDYIRLRTEEERSLTHFQPFALNEEVKLHIYCSEAPCGDASMELTIASQDDPTPWVVPPPPSTASQEPQPLLAGRANFSLLSQVRRKPSRPDAPPTLSKSCSDKLSLSQTTSLLSSLTSLLISPANIYLSTLTLPSSQHSSTGCTRAFSSSGRMAPVSGRDWGGGYAFREFKIMTTEKEFVYSRRQDVGIGETIVPSNISASYIYNPRVLKAVDSFQSLEVLIGGVLQGRKTTDLRAASKVCRRAKWRLAVQIAGLLGGRGVDRIREVLGGKTYADVKGGALLEGRRDVKRDVTGESLKGWVRNGGDEGWGLDDR